MTSSEPSYTLLRMKEENRITQSDIDQASVKLEPIAGISPRVYVPLAWGLILLFAIFAVVGYLVIFIRSGSTGRYFASLRGSETAAASGGWTTSAAAGGAASPQEMLSATALRLR